MKMCEAKRLGGNLSSRGSARGNAAILLGPCLARMKRALFDELREGLSVPLVREGRNAGRQEDDTAVSDTTVDLVEKRYLRIGMSMRYGTPERPVRSPSG